MQQNQPGRRFENTAAQQPVYRFPQNQSAQGWTPQQSFPAQQPEEELQLSKRERRTLSRRHRQRRKILTWWNLFAVIGIISVIVQFARYVVIPLLVYMNVLAGGNL